MSAFFLNPALLGFLGLGALPVLIHLLNRQRYKRVRWAAMEFLLEAHKRTYRRLRLENLLLLLLRTLAVLLAALAFARPFAAKAGHFADRDPVSCLVLVDDTLSMGCRTGGATRLEKGLSLLRKRLDDLPKLSLVTIALASRPEAVLRDGDLDAAAKALDEIQPSDSAADVPAALAREVPALLKSPLTRREVCIVTDLQVSSWPVGPAGPAGEAKGDAAFEPLVKTGVPVRILDASDGHMENLAATGLRMASRAAVAGRPLRMQALLKNLGNAARHDVEVLLLVDGQVRDRQLVDVVDAGAERSAALFTTFPEPGIYAVEARAAEDALAADDRRSTAVEVTHGIDVLLVDGDPASDPVDAETYFLARALSPAGSQSPVRVTERSVLSFGAGDAVDFHAFDAVMLLNVPALDPTQALRLESWVREGGRLLLALGDNTALADWNERAWRDGQGFLPARLGAVRAPDDPAAERFASLRCADAAHPAAASLADSKTTGLMNVRRFVSCEPKASPEVRVPWMWSVENVLAGPAVVDAPFGVGRVLLVTTALDLEWGDMPRSFDYVALAHDLLHALLRGGRSRDVVVGRPATFDLGGEHAGATLLLVGPDGKTERAEVVADAASRLRVSTGPLTRSGAYALASGSPDHVIERLAANPDPAESDLSPAARAAVERRLAGLQVSFTTAAGGGSAKAAGGGAEYWRTVLMIVAVLLAAESFLAWRFGRE